jgi:hypothetical protein
MRHLLIENAENCHFYRHGIFWCRRSTESNQELPTMVEELAKTIGENFSMVDTRATHAGQERCAPPKAEYICADLSFRPQLFPCSRTADHTYSDKWNAIGKHSCSVDEAQILRADQRAGIDRASLSGAHSPRSIRYIFPVDAHPARRYSSVIRSGRKTSRWFRPSVLYWRQDGTHPTSLLKR